MYDTHQYTQVSEMITEILFHPPPFQFYTEISDSYHKNQRRLFSC